MMTYLFAERFLISPQKQENCASFLIRHPLPRIKSCIILTQIEHVILYYEQQY